MPEIARFSTPGRVEVALHRADALTLRADLAIIGRCREVRDRLEDLTGERFRAYLKTTVTAREVAILESDEGPWRRTLSLDYRPRAVDLEKRRHGEVPLSNLVPHFDALYSDLSEAFNLAAEEFQPSTVLFLPLSWRNPRVVALAAVGVVWSYCHGRSSVIRSLAELGSEPRKPGIERFLLVDRDDPAPFLRGLENRDGEMVEVLGLEEAGWKSCPFIPTAPDEG